MTKFLHILFSFGLFSVLFIQAQTPNPKLTTAQTLYLGKQYENAFPILKELAEANQIEAQYLLGEMYFYGYGTPKDATKAFEWTQKAAEQGLVFAQDFLGIMYNRGIGTTKDLEKSFSWHLKAAEQGYSNAQYNTGWSYENGFGTPKSYPKSAEWYRKAAEKDHETAQYRLGLFYHEGRGVGKDASKALMWYRKAAEQDFAQAKFALGTMYLDGEGVAANRTTAKQWFQQAAEQNDAPSQLYLGNILLQEQSFQTAERWFLKAIEQNIDEAYYGLIPVYMQANRQREARALVDKLPPPRDDQSKFVLANFLIQSFHTPQNIQRGIRLLTEFGNAGKLEAQYILGGYFMDIQTKDYAKAFYWHKKAADRGWADSQSMVGVLYDQGWGVAKSRINAIHYYKLAARQGNLAAQSRLRGMKISW